MFYILQAYNFCKRLVVSTNIIISRLRKAGGHNVPLLGETYHTVQELQFHGSLLLTKRVLPKECACMIKLKYNSVSRQTFGWWISDSAVSVTLRSLQPVSPNL